MPPKKSSNNRTVYSLHKKQALLGKKLVDRQDSSPALHTVDPPRTSESKLLLLWLQTAPGNTFSPPRKNKFVAGNKRLLFTVCFS